VGSRLVTLYVVGRNSGRVYPVPVAYLRNGSDLLIGTSFGWGRNLRTGESVAIRLNGRLRSATARVSTTEPEVLAAYAYMARLNPTFARFNCIRIGADGKPDLHDLHLAWAGGARAIRLTPD
jgi:deazaflavin-dependent oxidoreductase (nitroreductase family)